MTDLRATQEIRVPTDAEIAAEHSRGAIPTHEMRNWSESCDLADTQELPAIEDAPFAAPLMAAPFRTRPASEWGPSALDRLWADVMAVGR